jgi:RND family efflux transporter MFP subunit
MTKLTRWFAIGVPVLALGGIIFTRIKSEKAGAEDLQSQSAQRKGAAPSVEIAVAGPQKLDEIIEAVGNTEAPYSVQLAPRVSGRITFLEAREGDTVNPGQLLVRIDPSEANAAVSQQRATVTEARARLAQAEATATSNSVSIESEIRSQKAALSSAQEELRQNEQNYEALVAAADSKVTDARARQSAAETEVGQARAELRAAQSRLKNAQRDYDRVKALFDQGYRAGKDVEDAATLVETVQADVDLANGKISSNQSAVESAKAQVTSAEKELSIAKQKGKADISAAKARVEQAKAAVDEATANRGQVKAYNENLKALRASVAAAEAGAAQAGIKKDDTELKSPIAGTVTKRGADPGSLAGAGQSLLTIEYLDWLYVTASLSVDEAGRVKQGQEVEIAFDAAPGQAIKGTVADVNQSADPRSRQFTIRIRLENPTREFRPGMFARLNLIVSSTQATVAVPSAAVKEGKEGPTVTVLDAEDKAVPTVVKVGRRTSKFVEITEGLKPGDRVITLSYAPVKEGQKVTISGAADEKKAGDRK